MARKRIGSDEEKLDENSIERVIAYLKTKGATKKTACQMLNISYNTSRLDKLIETYHEKKAKDAERRAAKRGKPATQDEVDYIVTEYLGGATFEAISKSLARGNTFIKNILQEYAVPERNSTINYKRPALIPEEASRTEFRIGEVVWSAKYESMAIVNTEIEHKDGKVYRVWLKDEHQQQWAYQPCWELASLQKLRDKGIKI